MLAKMSRSFRHLAEAFSQVDAFNEDVVRSVQGRYATDQLEEADLHV